MLNQCTNKMPLLIFNDQDFETTNKLCDTVLSLPMRPYLSEKDVERVCKVIKEFSNASIVN